SFSNRPCYFYMTYFIYSFPTTLFSVFFFFFFNDPPTTYIYTLSLHDALPIYVWCEKQIQSRLACWRFQNENALDECGLFGTGQRDRKSTRLNPVTFRSRMPSSA